jgi:hypothetical protein
MWLYSGGEKRVPRDGVSAGAESIEEASWNEKTAIGA